MFVKIIISECVLVFSCFVVLIWFVLILLGMFSDGKVLIFFLNSLEIISSFNM